MGDSLYDMPLRILIGICILLFWSIGLSHAQVNPEIEQKIQQINELVKAELPVVDSLNLLISELESLSSQSPDERNNLYIGYFRGVLLLRMELTDSAINTLNHTLENIPQAERDSSLLYASVSLVLGNAYYNKGEFKNALSKYLEVKTETERIGKEETAYNANFNIGLLYMKLAELDLAYEYLSKAKDRFDALLPSAQARLLSGFGTYYSQTGRLDSAAYYYRKGMEAHKANGDLRGVAHGFNNLAIVAYQNGNVEEAILGFEAAMDVKLQLGNRRNISDGYYNIGLLYAGQGRYRQAIENYREGLNQIRGIGSLVSEIELLFELADSFKQVNEMDSAYHYITEWRILHDSLLQINTRDEIIALETEFRTKELEKDAALAAKDIALKTSQRNVLFVGLGASIIIALIMFYWLSSRYKRNMAITEKEKLLAEKQSELTLKELALKQEEVINYTNQLIHKNEVLEAMKSRLEEQTKISDSDEIDYEHIAQTIRTSLYDEKNWFSFKLQFEKAYPGFLENLVLRNPDLSGNDQRLATLIKVNLSNKEIGQVLNISSDSVAKAKYRLRQKMGFDHYTELENFILKA